MNDESVDLEPPSLSPMAVDAHVVLPRSEGWKEVAVFFDGALILVKQVRLTPASLLEVKLRTIGPPQGPPRSPKI